MNKILAILFFCCLTSGANAATLKDVNYSQLNETIGQVMDTAVNGGFSGSVFLTHKGNVVFEKSYGLMNSKDSAHIDARTRFNLASTGKMFTSVAIHKLVEQEKIALDVPIGRYLPDWPVKNVRDKVTVRHLLTHTSGLGSYFGKTFREQRHKMQSLNDYIPLMSTEPAFEPGSAWQYSNIGFQLLGLIIERIENESFYDVIQRLVFTPAGMTDTGYFEMDGVASGVATPHVGGNQDSWAKTYGMPEPRGGAAGGGFSTPRDLYKFHQALISGRLLSKSATQKILSVVELPKGTQAPPHGLGVISFEVDGGIGYGHPGGAEGVGVDFRATQNSDWCFVLMASVNEPFSMELGNQIMSVLAKAGGPDLVSPFLPKD